MIYEEFLIRRASSLSSEYINTGAVCARSSSGVKHFGLELKISEKLQIRELAGISASWSEFQKFREIFTWGRQRIST